MSTQTEITINFDLDKFNFVIGCDVDCQVCGCVGEEAHTNLCELVYSRKIGPYHQTIINTILMVTYTDLNSIQDLSLTIKKFQ